MTCQFDYNVFFLKWLEITNQMMTNLTFEFLCLSHLVMQLHKWCQLTQLIAQCSFPHTLSHHSPFSRTARFCSVDSHLAKRFTGFMGLMVRRLGSRQQPVQSMLGAFGQATLETATPLQVLRAPLGHCKTSDMRVMARTEHFLQPL